MIVICQTFKIQHMRTILVFSFALFTALSLPAQELLDLIKREIDIAGNAGDQQLVIRNINGGIEVEGYNGRQVVVEVTRTIRSGKGDLQRKGREEIQLGVVEKQGLVLLYMQSPCSRDKPEAMSREDLVKDWGSLWKEDCKWEPNYEYRLDFRVKIPAGMSANIATVNEGDIQVRNVRGALRINNVNGAITVEGAAASTDVHTINGDVNIDYDRNPAESCRYYTLNGNINATFRPGLKADLYFKSFNGDLFTDIEDVVVKPQLVEKKESLKKGQGVAYKIDAQRNIEVRGGGAELYFETFNGNVYIREQ